MCLDTFWNWLQEVPLRPEDQKIRPAVIDEQTGIPYIPVPESRLAAIVATIAALYCLAAIAFILWLLFDTWSGRNLLLVKLGYDKSIFARTSFRLVVFVALGGALGGAVDGMRSVTFWHSQRRAYGAAFIWKDLSLPLLGAALSLMVYAIVRGGVGALSGDLPTAAKNESATLAAFAISSIVGFSSFQVYKWLDAKGNKIFSTEEVEKKNKPQTIVPTIIGKTVDAAKADLAKRKLILAPGSAAAGIITALAPGEGARADEKSEVTITV